MYFKQSSKLALNFKLFLCCLMQIIIEYSTLFSFNGKPLLIGDIGLGTKISMKNLRTG
jgi:hypothetical protein